MLQQNQLDEQSERKEYSTSMSDDHMKHHRFPSGCLYRHPSEVASTLRLPKRHQLPTTSHLPFQITGYSVACERHPLRNEDNYFFDPRSALMAVFDGVGGSAAGEIASQIAAQATRNRWHEIRHQQARSRHNRNPLESCDKIDFYALLQQLLEFADEQVRTEGAHLAGTTDLATTVTIAALCLQGSALKMYFAHVGDSRAYLLPKQGPLCRLTVDDGLLGRLVESQMMTEEDARRIDQAMSADELTDLELSYFRHRGGITQALGGPMRPHIHLDTTSVEPGDRVLLCTDGIHDNLTDAEIEQILQKSPRNLTARHLVEKSLLRSREERLTTIRAKPDDMTAVVFTRIH